MDVEIQTSEDPHFLWTRPWQSWLYALDHCLVGNKIDVGPCEGHSRYLGHCPWVSCSIALCWDFHWSIWSAQPLLLWSSLPHPVTNYFCHIGKAIKDLGYVGYQSRILPAIPGDWVEYAEYISWYNNASRQWESLPKGYTTEEPWVTHPLGDVEEWWEEAEIIAQHWARPQCQARQSGNKTESGDEKDSGDQVESGRQKEYGHEAESRHEADQDCEMGYQSESSLTPSDYSKSKKSGLVWGGNLPQLVKIEALLHS